MARQEFDVVVVGTGAAARTVIGRCSEAGLSVAVVDRRAFGGTCQLRGCDPKKVLRRAAEVIDAARLLEDKGLSGELAVDWPALMAFKRSFTDPVPERLERDLARKGVAAFHGIAHFETPTGIAVGDDRLLGRQIVLACGAEPRPLDFPGSGLLTLSDDFLDLDALPRRILFAGGGYVSLEFAHIAARAGADVLVLDRGERPLGAFDPDLVDLLAGSTRRAGIDLRSNAEIEAVARTGNGLVVEASINGARRTFEADMVVHGAGRVPAIADLDLKKGSVEAGDSGVAVNEYLRSTSNPAVFAAGDVAATGAPPLTPVAGLEGGVVADNVIDRRNRSPDYAGIPSEVFTIPALARVGLLQSEADERGLDVDIRYSDMSKWYSVRRLGHDTAAAKVLVDRKSDGIVGAHLLGPAAGELVNLFALAIRNGLRAPAVKSFLSAYPTAGSDLSHLV